MSLKLIGYTAAIFAVLAMFIFLYQLGFEAGQDAERVDYQDAVSKAQVEYEVKLRERLEEQNDHYRAAEKKFREDYEQRILDAAAAAEQHAIADDKAEQINETIENISYKCGDSNVIDSGAFRVYQQTRSIISRPDRVTDTARNTDTN